MSRGHRPRRPEAVAAACAEVAPATGETVSAANFNSPEQTVIAGTAAGGREGVGAPEAEGRQARPAAPGLGALPLRADEAGRGEALAVPRRDPVRRPRDPGRHERRRRSRTPSGAAAREALRRQVCSPVRWVETVELLARAHGGGDRGRARAVLAGLGKRIAKDWPVRTTSDADGIGKLLAEMSR